MTFLAQPPRQTERSFQAQVVKLAELLGWRWYHTHRSDRSPAGFPDLVLVRPAGRGRSGRVVFVELKAQRTPVTLDQRSWLQDLVEAEAEVYLWRPSDWRTIERTLAA